MLPGVNLYHEVALQPRSANLAYLVLFGFRVLEALKFDLNIKVGWVLKIQENLYLIGTEIFQFGPRKAEQFTFKDCIKSNKNTDF